MVAVEFKSQFANADVPTAAVIIQRLMQISDLTARERRDMTSAWKSTSIWFAIPVDALVAHPQNLAPRFAQLSSGGLGVSVKRIANVKSLVMKSIEFTCNGVGKSFKAPLTPEWISLLEKVPTLYDSASIRCIARYACARELAPHQIDEEFSSALLQALIDERLNKNPRIIHQNAVRRWNSLSDAVAGWPQAKLQPPRYRKQPALPWSAYPTTLNAEIDEFFAQKKTTDPLDLSMPLVAWSDGTVTKYRGDLRRILSRIVECGVEPDELLTVADVLHVERIVAALEKTGVRKEAAGRASAGSAASVVSQLARFAENRPGASEELKLRFGQVAETSKAMAKRLHKMRKRSQKNRERLSPFKDEANLAELFLLPFALERKLKGVRNPDRRDALLMQWAVALMILVFCPLRVESLSSLSLDQHLRWSGRNMTGALLLEFADGELKNGQPATLPLPIECSRMIRLYVERFRPLLAKSDDRHLFSGSKPSRSKRPAVLGLQLKRLVYRCLGRVVNVHLFRHVVHLVVLRRFPGAYGMIARVLTHRGVSTATKNYAEYDATLAIATYDELVRGVQSGGGVEDLGSLADRIYLAMEEKKHG